MSHSDAEVLVSLEPWQEPPNRFFYWLEAYADCYHDGDRSEAVQHLRQFLESEGGTVEFVGLISDWEREASA